MPCLYNIAKPITILILITISVISLLPAKINFLTIRNFRFNQFL